MTRTLAVILLLSSSLGLVSLTSVQADTPQEQQKKRLSGAYVAMGNRVGEILKNRDSVVSRIKETPAISKDYLDLLDQYSDLAREYESIAMINSTGGMVVTLPPNPDKGPEMTAKGQEMEAITQKRAQSQKPPIGQIDQLDQMEGDVNKMVKGLNSLTTQIGGLS